MPQSVLSRKLLLIASAALLLGACKGENRPTQVSAGPTATAGTVGTPCPTAAGGTGSVSGPATGSVSVAGHAPAGCPSGGPQAGVLKPKPADATQVDVTLAEWSIAPAVASIKAGQIYFFTKNVGPVNAHELVIIKSDLAPDQLPLVEGRVPEDKVTIIGEIEPFLPNSAASGLFTLQPGKYVLICNIRELEGFAYVSHYKEGMRTGFEVTT